MSSSSRADPYTLFWEKHLNALAAWMEAFECLNVSISLTALHWLEGRTVNKQDEVF